jgi:hypothetical protein
MSTDPTQQSGSGQPPYYEYGPTGNTDDPYANQYSQQPYGDPYSPPPPPNYAYTSYGGAPQAAPLPLSQALGQLPNQYWKVVSKPGAATFAEEAGKAEWGIILVQLFGYAIIAAILGTISSAISRSSMQSLINQINANSGTTTTPPAATLPPAANLFISLVGILIGFFIVQGILFGLAKAFGGQGTFTAQAYSALLYQVPLGFVSSLLAFIPILGGLVGLAAGIYEIVLAVFMIMGVHRLSGGKASAVVLIPLGVLVLLVCILFIVAFAFIAAAIRASQP